MSRPRQVKLREASATVFALTAILPLLLLVLLLWRYDVIGQTEAQISVGLALATTLLGYAVFRRLTDRIARVSRALTPGLSTPAAVDINAVVDGLGQVSEIGDLARAFSQMLEELRAATARLEDLVFKLGTINDMVEMAAKIPKIEDLLSHVLDRTMRAVSAQIGSIMLLDPERRTLRVAVGRGLDHEVRTGVEVRVGEGIAGKVVELGEPVLVADIEKDPRFARLSHPRYGGSSFICMPLRVGERIVGVVNLAKKEHVPGGTAAFSQSDLQFLNALMTYTAYAVDNARLFEGAQRAAARLREVVEDQQLRLTLAQQQMVEAAKLSALGVVVAGVAHELSNPLTALGGLADIIHTQVPEPLRPNVELMKEAVDRASRVVRGLLTFARRMPLDRQAVDLAQLVKGVLDVTMGDLGLARIEVSQEVEEDLPPVWADRNQIQQVLINLVTNARQAMARAGERRLRLAIGRPRHDTVHIQVEDTGPGIPPELLPKIFDPFVSTKGADGTGLGLSISYGIIQEHGGDLRVENTGHGARFTIELPVGGPSTPSSPIESPAPSLTGKRVLVAESDPSVRNIVVRHLRDAGCEVAEVAAGAEVLDRLGPGIDVIVYDMNLPDMDAIALLREMVVRHRGLSLPLVFLASGPMSEATDRSLSEGRSRILKKPFTKEQLLRAIDQALR